MGALAPLPLPLSTPFTQPPPTLLARGALTQPRIARCQAMLPVHCDESVYSITLPLNDTEEYAGGGTFFFDLRR